MYEFVWLVSGIVIYRIFSAFSGYDSLSSFVREVYLLGLVFLSATAEDLLAIKKLKYKLLQQTKSIGEEELKLLQLVDEQMMENWKQTSISRFVSVWPKRYQKVIDHKTWDETMNVISDRYKEEIWK